MKNAAPVRTGVKTTDAAGAVVRHYACRRFGSVILPPVQKRQSFKQMNVLFVLQQRTV